MSYQCPSKLLHGNPVADDPCLATDPDMQGFAVRVALVISHIGMGLLLNLTNKSDIDQLRTCFFAFFFQLFPIMLGTLLSVVRGELSVHDAMFAMEVLLSPATMTALSLFYAHVVRHRLRQPCGKIFLLGCTLLILAIPLAVYISALIVMANCGSEAQWNLPITADPQYTVPGLLTLVLHIVGAPGSFILRYLIQWTGWGRISLAAIPVMVLYTVQISGVALSGHVQARYQEYNPLFEDTSSPMLSLVVIIVLELAMSVSLYFFDTLALHVLIVLITWCWLATFIKLPLHTDTLLSKIQVIFKGIDIFTRSDRVVYTATNNVHPRRYLLFELSAYILWAAELRIFHMEHGFRPTYGQIVALLSTIPIGIECFYLAKRSWHARNKGLSPWRRIVIAVLPLRPSTYKSLQDSEIFPDPLRLPRHFDDDDDDDDDGQ